MAAVVLVVPTAVLVVPTVVMWADRTSGGSAAGFLGVVSSAIPDKQNSFTVECDHEHQHEQGDQ